MQATIQYLVKRLGLRCSSPFQNQNLMPGIWVSKSLVPSGGAEPNHTTVGKTGPLLIIQHSLDFL
jgi:hypothetical protein